MATKTIKKEVKIDSSAISVGEVVSKGNEAPLWSQLVAFILLDDLYKDVKANFDALKERITSANIDAIKDSLVKGGFMSDGDDPTIVIDVPATSASKGYSIKASLSGYTDSGFTVDKSLESLLESLPSDMTQTKTTLESKKVLEAMFDAGAIPEVYNSYFSKAPSEKTKITCRCNKED